MFNAKRSKISPLLIAIKIAIIIAIPLLGLGIPARIFDKSQNSSPLFFLVAVFIALSTSTFLVFRLYVKTNVKDVDKKTLK